MSICISWFSTKRVCVALWTLIVTSSVYAANPFSGLEKAVMPGPVIEGHAKFEEDCQKCHTPFKKGIQNDLCLDCHDHKNIRDDITKEEGFHGRIADIKNRSCKVCHTEHKGRKADVVLLDEATFNHDQTDFARRGSHKKVKCENCHDPKKKFYEAKNKCVDCHEQDEPHKGKLGKRCEACHNEVEWRTFIFDHAKTQFPLIGKHIGVRCPDCHVNERYKGIPTKCFVCHKSDDKHKGQFGEKCQDCHTEEGWHVIKFNHDKDTKFKLEGQHKTVSCAQCHKGPDIYKENLKLDCNSCHKFKDEHKGLFGKKCEDCHTAKGWAELKFDHDKNTDWPLKGKHKKVACVDCHPGDLYKDDAPKDCYGCHRQDDVHNGQEGKKCNKCHSEDGWIKSVDFDHDLTKFPLLGAHATATCEECHSTTNFKDTKGTCATCHEKDDFHKKKQGPYCGRCHNSVDWKKWIFDHDKETKFKLDGKHKKQHCDQCHTKPVEDKMKMDSTCFACHAKDDVHGGSYGRLCNRCHNTEAFKDFSRQGNWN